MFKFKSLNDNTHGFRFDVIGTKGIYRKRLLKTRYGMTKGETFVAFHMGKRSLYIEQFKPLRCLYRFAG